VRRIDSATGGAIAWTAVLTLFAVLSLARLTSTSAGHDFFQFWSFGRALDSPMVTDLYAPNTAREVSAQAARQIAAQGSVRGARAAQTNRKLYASGVEPISTPLYYAAFAALAGESYDADLDAFQWLSSLALFAAGWFACRSLGYSRHASALALTALALVFGPLHADIETGNVNRLQLALLAAALVLQRRGNLATVGGGALLGLCVALKPNLAAVPLFLAWLWCVDRRLDVLLRAAAGWGLGAASAALLAVVVLPLSAWSQWWAALAVYGTRVAGVAQGNWGSAQWLREVLGIELSGILGATLLVSFCAVSWISRETERTPAERDWIAVSAAGLALLIASPIVWDHYYLMVLPALLWWLRPGAAGAAIQIGAAFALVLFAINPLRVAWPGLDASGLASSLCAASVLSWLLLLLDIGRRPASASPEP
jgi:hypothetical protein